MAKAKEWKPRRVRSEDDRGGSSGYISLDEGEKFLGHMLFEGDPAVDEPGYYEFLEHWDTKTNRSIPCAGDDCPFCRDGDKARDKAKTLWLVLVDEKGNKLGEDGEGELRIFNMNSLVIKQITEMRGEGEKLYGRLFRVSRADDRGTYVLMPKDTAKSLKKSEVKELLKSKDAPDFEKMVTSTLRKAMEGISTSRAMEDDDDDEDEEEKPKKRGRAAKDEEPDDDEEEEETEDEDEEESEGLDEVTLTVTKVDKKGNWIEAEDEDETTFKVWTTDDIEFDLTELSKGDEVVISATGPDDDDDYVLSAEPVVEEGEAEEEEDEDEKPAKGKGKKAKDEDEEEEESDLPDALEDIECEVVRIDSNAETLDLSSEELGTFTLYFLDSGPASKVDFDDYEKGQTLVINAEKDSQGDLVATTIPKVKGAKKKTTSSGSSGSKKKSSSAKKKSTSKSTSKKSSSKKSSSKKKTSRR